MCVGVSGLMGGREDRGIVKVDGVGVLGNVVGRMSVGGS